MPSWTFRVRIVYDERIGDELKRFHFDREPRASRTRSSPLEVISQLRSSATAPRVISAATQIRNHQATQRNFSVIARY